MSNNFMSAMKKTLNDEYNVSVTENGAVGYRTSGKDLLDLNFAVSSLRRATPTDIAERFTRAFFEDQVTAMKWLFFARDIRGGLGERRLFRIVLEYMAKNSPEYVKPVIRLVPEYGRWDDLWCLFDTDLQGDVLDVVCAQLKEDIANMNSGNSVSLLAKWLPSIHSSSADKRRYAKLICGYIGIQEWDYRRALSALRTKLDIVEKKMSAKEWDEIKYEAVPSRANLIYNSAFLRHDEERRREFLSRLEKGETKINASTLFPHDIVHRYTDGGWCTSVKALDQTLEALWKSLPDTVNGCGNMEFDGCTVTNAYRRGYGRYGSNNGRVNNRLFTEISKRYTDAGYQLPRLVFWNVNSRTGTIPVTENDLGVALVSGFSTNIVKMVMSGQTDPYECLLETLNTERYAPVEEALRGL